MAFISFVGRVLFVSVFLFSAWQEFNDFGDDGGAAAKSLSPKYNVFSKHVSLHLGFEMPEVEMKNLVIASVSLKAVGSLLFIFGSTPGAILLILHQLIATPIMYDFYNYEAEKKESAQLFVKFTQESNLALLGALFFFVGMMNSTPRRSPKKKGSKSKTV